MVSLDDPNAYVGAVLRGAWRIRRPIGQGGLALVYEAVPVVGEAPLSGSPGVLTAPAPVAVKILRREFHDEPAVIERFLSEAKVGERIRHANVARVHEAARAEDGTPFLVLDLLPGAPLTTRMNQGPLPPSQAVAIAAGLLEVLAAAHDAGVVHRDLKPDNVFVVSGPDAQPEVKLLDFGLARVMDEAGGMGRKTKTGMVLGTPGYMSPEQIHDAKSADLRTDLWSTGVLLYEMLTGQRAFHADTEMGRVTAILTTEPRRLDVVAPQYAHWSDFFDRALAKDLSARFQTAREMSSALSAAARGGYRSVAPPPASVASGAVPSSAAPPSAASGGPFGGVPTAMSAPLPAGVEVRERLADVQVVAPARRVGTPALIAVLVAVALVLGVVIGVLVVGQ